MSWTLFIQIIVLALVGTLCTEAIIAAWRKPR